MKTVLIGFEGVACTDHNIEENILAKIFPRFLDAQINSAYRSFKFNRITEDEFWSTLDTDPARGRAELLTRLKADPKLRETIAYLKRKNYATVLFADFPKAWLDLFVRTNKLESAFDDVVSTCFNGFAANSPRLYAQAKADFGECVLVEDQLAALETAAKSGVMTVWKKTIQQETSFEPDYVIRYIEELQFAL